MRRTATVITALLMLLLEIGTAGAQGTPQRASGSYVADAMGASIVAQNVDYITIFKAGPMVPAGSRITKVSWRYSLSGKAPGFEAVLCWHEQQPCWNITNSNNGSTQWFNGKDASQAFSLHYRVKSSGPLGPPNLGQMDQIIVSYEIAP